ncbi:MAG: insulinase family protein, partial [Candidatus Obscuribacterales bacterium]|nr:insulinase family protein [Candidatus Obscuribacterales bacterium]
TLKISRPLIPITKEFTLQNGLTVIVSEDHSAPVASLVLIYDVGARDESKGKSGFAHLFEHMMFEGSKNIPKGDFFKHVQSAGGMLNASTHSDYTDYFEKVPSNQIELLLWLEADRMRSLKVTEDNFKNQLETVKEEKRLRIDNQAYVPAELELEELIFDNWANSHPVIGYFEDLESSSVADVKEFFDTYYVPNNAVMAIVGDVDAQEIEKLVEKYFASIERGKTPPRPVVEEPQQTKPKYLKIKDAHAKLPAFWLAWKAPARREKDSYVLNLIQAILAMGPSSRLYQRLVKDDKVALKVSASYEERRGPSNINFFVVTKPGTNTEKNPDQVKEIVLAEINKIKTEPVTTQELEKAKNQILRLLFSSSSHYSLQSSLGRAEMLAQCKSFFGKPDLVDEDVEIYLSITVEDIKRVAKKVFTESGITTVEVVPAEKNKEAIIPGPIGLK